MVYWNTKSTRELPQARFRLWFVVMIIISLPLWVGGCGKGEKAVVAEVNGQRITVKDFHAELARVPEDVRVVYEQEPEDVLNRLIGVTLLLQEAKRKGLVASSDLKDIDKPGIQEGMRRLIKPEMQDVKVTDQEVQVFYRQYRDQMGGRPFSEVREVIRMMILEQKRQERISVLVERLRATASITAYPERLPKPPPPPLEASTAEAFQEALRSGRPTVVDFSSKNCPECIRLRPVMRALKDAHGERINVLLLEVSDQRALARQYAVRLVPTIIFFDAQGREAKRKAGFMNRGEIEKVLRDLTFLGA